MPGPESGLFTRGVDPYPRRVPPDGGQRHSKSVETNDPRNRTTSTNRQRYRTGSPITVENASKQVDRPFPMDLTHCRECTRAPFCRNSLSAICALYAFVTIGFSEKLSSCCLRNVSVFHTNRLAMAVFDAQC